MFYSISAVRNTDEGIVTIESWPAGKFETRAWAAAMLFAGMCAAVMYPLATEIRYYGHDENGAHLLGTYEVKR